MKHAPKSAEATKARAFSWDVKCPNEINDLHDLQCHLQWALAVEHATIPPYLCALYSIPEGHNVEAATLIRSVVMEEMLHMTLVANVLNAVGGTPHIYDAKFVHRYPTYLPHSADAFKVHLRPLCPDAVDTFLHIEQPAKAGAKPEGDHYHTLGQFYEAIEDGLKRLCAALGPEKVFTGHADRQVQPGTWYYGGGGDVVAVHDLESALSALEEVMEQGEGFSGEIFDHDGRFNDVDELAHYFRFMELKLGRRYQPTDTPSSGPTGNALPIDWSAILPMNEDPHSEDYRAYPSIHRQMVIFNRIYTRLLGQLQKAFSGNPGALRDAAPIMYELKYQAEALMRIPSPLAPGMTVGPAFEFDAESAAI